MTTSGVTAFSLTRNEIITMALEDLGVYAPGFETPTAGQISSANKRLNAMIKAWQANDVGLWLNTVHTQVLTAATESYSLGPATLPTPIARPIGIVEARVVDTDGNELDMTAMSRDEYMKLPLKSSTGKPTQYYYDPQLVNGVFYIWPVADDITDVIKMTVRTPIQVFVNIADTPDFPEEWFDALHFNLALRLAPGYRVDAKQYQMVREMASITLADADGFDREQNVSVLLTPDVSEQ